MTALGPVPRLRATPPSGGPDHRSILVEPILARLRDAGQPIGDIIARHGLPPDAAKGGPVSLPLTAFKALCSDAAARLDDPSLGLHLAIDLPRGAYGVTEFLCRAAPSCREAVQMILDHAHLIHTLAVFSFSERQGIATIDMLLPSEPDGQGDVANHFALCIFLRFARQIIGRSFVPRKVWFAHEGEAHPELVSFVGTSRIEYGKGSNGVQMDAALLDIRAPQADEALYAYLRPQGDAISARGKSELDKLRERIATLVSKGEPTVERLATELNVSPRTMQRLLADHGTTFRDLSDEVRCSLATQWLADRKLTLDVIAQRLAYSDVRALRRAYKRWSGRTLVETRLAVAPTRARAARARSV